MMRDDFAIFILSHQRVDEQLTYKALKDANYTGKLYILIDNLDNQKDEYIKRYGNSIIIFDKEKYFKLTDTITNTSEMGSPVFARNACYDIAKELKLKYFAEFDDDIPSFNYRYIKDNKLKGKFISNVDNVFNTILNFIDKTKICSFGITNNGAFFGGANGEKYNTGLDWNINQAFILSVNQPIEFKGILNEDINALLLGAKSGKKILEYTHISQNAPPRHSNKGGLEQLYNKSNDYVTNFYTVIIAPYCSKIKVNNNKISLSVKKVFAYPKIINERWKK